MTNTPDHARIGYLIRRPPRADDDAMVAINAQKLIRQILGKHIVPFDLIASNKVSIDNTGILIRVDKHDLNSLRIDVNVLEPFESPSKTFTTLQNLSFKCLSELQKGNTGRDVRCFLSFELKK